ncbi:hypothetical protein GCM10009810_08560 [Nostocoides vanveenii]|uniref:Uncharacterized protein n=2 Tax=Nostocoides vanveenii TaxID=330835 RepID=A0ABP4WEP9_9MICO
MAGRCEQLVIEVGHRQGGHGPQIGQDLPITRIVGADQDDRGARSHGRVDADGPGVDAALSEPAMAGRTELVLAANGLEAHRSPGRGDGARRDSGAAAERHHRAGDEILGLAEAQGPAVGGDAGDDDVGAQFADDKDGGGGHRPPETSIVMPVTYPAPSETNHRTTVGALVQIAGRDRGPSAETTLVSAIRHTVARVLDIPDDLVGVVRLP